ncbi:MAG: AAA family ATPase [Elusimicrobia bacterium]|nr:AAA family ATPase [Elusimicrobiota bacterium]
MAQSLPGASGAAGKDPIPLLREAAKRHEQALRDVQADALALLTPYIFREPLYAHHRARALLHGLRNREIRFIQRVLSQDRVTLDAVGPIYHAADLLTETLGDIVQDLTSQAQQEIDRSAIPTPSMDEFPEGQSVLNRVQASLERPGLLTTGSLVVSSDRQKKPLLRALAHRFRNQRPGDPLAGRKLVYVDLMKVFSDPSRDRIVYESLTEQPDGTPGLLRLAAQTGDVVVVLDLDAFQFEDMPVLDRVLEYWSGMSRRGFSPPPLVALASEPTQQLYLRKSKMFREYFEAAPAFSSSAATRALLNFDANTLGRRLGVEIPPALIDRAYAEVQNRTPYDRHSMALRVLEAAATLERAAPGPGAAVLRPETVDRALRELPSMENLPLEARLWARREVFPPEVSEEADREIRRYGMLKGNPEQPRVAEFLNSLIRFPWTERAPDLIPGSRTLPAPALDLARQEVLASVRASLDQSHSGLEEPKAEMLQYVVQLLQRETGQGRKAGWNLLLVGPPGVGKTTLVRAFSRAIQNRKFEVIPLGGMDDEAELAGHRRTYIGARMGKLARALLDLGISNPIVGLDEIDKLGARNGDPRAFLLQALDPEQNKDFRDRYLGPTPLDGVIFIATANSLNIPGPLLDRFTVIHVPGYSVDEKVDIGARHVLPRLREEIPIASEIDIPNPRSLVRAVARGYTWEEGARRLVKLLRKVLLRSLREWFDRGETITVDNESLGRFLGKPWEYPAIRAEDRVGEVAVPTTRGQLRFVRAGAEADSAETGLIVNQTWGPATVNSARLAGDLVSHRLETAARELGMDALPETARRGALRLDAPGGIGEDDSTKGLAFVVAMMSRRLNRPVRRDAVFAGEIDLRGRVLDVPEVRQRAIAAREAGARYLFLPSASEAHLFQEAFKTAPYLIGPVLNLASGLFWIRERSLRPTSGPQEKAAVERWNASVQQLAKNPPPGAAFRSGERPGEWTVTGSREVLVDLLADLPSLSGQMVYCLIDDPAEAVRLGLAGSPASRWPDSKASALSWENDVMPIEGPAKPAASTLGSSSGETAASKTLEATPLREAPWLFDLGGSTVDLESLLADPLENSDTLMTLFDRAIADEGSRPRLVNVLRALVYSHPQEMTQFVEGICADPDFAEYRQLIFDVLPVSLAGQMLANYRAGITRTIQAEFQENASRLEKLESALLQRHSRSAVAAENDRRLLQKQFAEFLELVRKDVADIGEKANEDFLKNPLRELESKAAAVSAATDQTIHSALSDLRDPISTIAGYLKARAYDFAFPQMSANQTEVRRVIDAQLNKLLEELVGEVFPSLQKEEKAMPRVGAIWKSYLAALSVQEETQRGRLALHGAETAGGMSSAFQATFEEATGVVVDLLDRQVFRSVNVVCPSDNTKAVFPGLLAERLKREHRPRRVITVEINQFPVDPRDALREMVAMMESAHRAGDVVFVIDLDEFRSRFGDTRARSLSRVLGRWTSQRNPLPLVFLSNEETNADFTENLPVFFRWIPQHRLRVANAQVLLEYEFDALERNGVRVDEAARRWLEIKMGKEEVDFALAASLLRDGAAEAHRQHRELMADDLETVWAHMQTGELTARVRMLPDDARRRGMALLAQMNNAQEGSHEYGNIRDVLENLVRFPWLKRTASPLPAARAADPAQREEEFRRAGRAILTRARAHLDESHYGMAEAKDEIADYLAEQIQRERHGRRGTGKVLCLVGPAGVGKSTLAESVARALGREFGRVPLGGTRDPAEIRGHSPTYQGAMPGNIVQTMQKMKVRNPVILLDEVEKMDAGIQGNPADVLLQALDEEQNDHFTDHNIGDVDLSEVLFIATANEEDKIPEPLKDRMEIVRLPAYDRAEKIIIGTDKLLPRVIQGLGVAAGQVQIPRPRDLITSLVDGYTQEPGVRELDKQLTRLVKRALSEVYWSGGKPVVLTVEKLREYMGLPRRGAASRAPVEVGEAMGLVVSPRGGGTINIQAEIRPGGDPNAAVEVVNFGQLQPDMLFSIETALSYIRKNMARLGGSLAALKGQRLLVNISPGDVKKDGPSAGIGFVATIFSALTGRPLRQDFAMTGQVDDEGKIYPIGGLKEKILAAIADRASTIILPIGNKEELIKSIFVQSPDLRGVIEENGIQRIAIEPKKPLGDKALPTAEDSTWEALNTLLSTKARQYGLVAEADRAGAVNLAGSPDQMTRFLNDAEIKKNVTSHVTYLIVSHVDQALNALLALGEGTNGVTASASPSPPLAGLAVGGGISALLGGLFFSPDSSAATLTQTLQWAAPLSSPWLVPVVLIAGVLAVKFVFGRVHWLSLSQSSFKSLAAKGLESMNAILSTVLTGVIEFLNALANFRSFFPVPPLGQEGFNSPTTPVLLAQAPQLASLLSSPARQWLEQRIESPGSARSQWVSGLVGWAEGHFNLEESRYIQKALHNNRTKGAIQVGENGAKAGDPGRLLMLVRSISPALNREFLKQLRQMAEDRLVGKVSTREELNGAMDRIAVNAWPSPEFANLDEEKKESTRRTLLEIQEVLIAALDIQTATGNTTASPNEFEPVSEIAPGELNSGKNGWVMASQAMFLRPTLLEFREVYVLDADLLNTKASAEVERLIKQQARLEGDNPPLVAIVSEKDDTAAVKSRIPSDRWGLPAARILPLGFDGLSRANAIEFAPTGRRVSLEALKTEIARQSGGGNGQALRVTLWAAAGRSEVFDGALVRLISVEEDLLLEGAAASAFIEQLRQLFPPVEADQMIRNLSPDGTGRVIRLPGRSPLLQGTISTIQTDLLIQTNA